MTMLFPECAIEQDISAAHKAHKYCAVEICAGGGGQALGVEKSGFVHVACVEYEDVFCETLRRNRPRWNVICDDIRNLNGYDFSGCDLLAGGVPCPPFSIAGKQLGNLDERDMFPHALRLVREMAPRAVMLENVKGLMAKKFDAYRAGIVAELERCGYEVQYRVLEASDYGVPQLRPRFVLVALRPEDMANFAWPEPCQGKTLLADAIGDLLEANGWDAKRFRDAALDVAPTLVGGSKKHGGPDLGPTRARAQWRKLGIDGRGVVADAPGADFAVDGLPRLTLRMVARIQGFPDDWEFCGRKTLQYRQIGNAFPPPIAEAVSGKIKLAFQTTDRAARRAARTEKRHAARQRV